MPITRTRSKYYVLSVLGAMVVALGVLAVAPSAQAQVAGEPSIDKECTPNPVQVGEQIICTIDVLPAPNTFALVFQFTDTFPAGVRPTDVIVEGVLQRDPRCEVAGQTVECDLQVAILNTPRDPFLSLRVTIDAIAEQCGTFPNTATATGGVFGVPDDDGQGESFSVTSVPEQITVEGCEEPPAPEPGQQQPNQQQGAPAPITQDFEQDSEAGEIDQTFDIS